MLLVLVSMHCFITFPSAIPAGVGCRTEIASLHIRCRNYMRTLDTRFVAVTRSRSVIGVSVWTILANHLFRTFLINQAKVATKFRKRDVPIRARFFSVFPRQAIKSTLSCCSRYTLVPVMPEATRKVVRTCFIQIIISLKLPNAHTVDMQTF